MSASRRHASGKTLKPVKKVSAATAAAAAVSTILWALSAWFGIEVPAHVQIELTTLAVFTAGWLKTS